MRGFAAGRLSRIYLTAVAVAIAASLWELTRWVERDAEVAGTYPTLATAPALFLTAPVSLLLEWWLMPARWTTWWSYTVPVVVGALVNTAVLDRVAALRRRRAAGTDGRPG